MGRVQRSVLKNVVRCDREGVKEAREEEEEEEGVAVA